MTRTKAQVWVAPLKSKLEGNMLIESPFYNERKVTPRLAVRRHCVECVGSPYEVKNCGGELIHNTGKECNLFPHRNGKGRVSVKTIRKECLACMGNSSKMVGECSSEQCNLYLYRFGKNPAYKLTNERKEALAKNLHEIRQRVSKAA